MRKKMAEQNYEELIGSSSLDSNVNDKILLFFFDNSSVKYNTCFIY